MWGVFGVPYQSVTFEITSVWLTNGISPKSPITLTKQANDSCMRVSPRATRPTVRVQKETRANAHQLFASEPSLSARISESVCQDKQTALVLSCVSKARGPGSDDVHISSPGAPPLADLGGYEGGQQASLPGLPDLPGRPIRRSGGGLCPTVLRYTEADGGILSYSALAVSCCLHPTTGCSPSVCLSPRVPSCCLHLCSSFAI